MNTIAARQRAFEQIMAARQNQPGRLDINAADPDPDPDPTELEPSPPMPSPMPKKIKPKPPSPDELLARQIERSSLTIEQIAKRSKVSPDQLEAFLAGDSDSLDDAERQRVLDVVQTVKALAATAKRAVKPVAAAIRETVNLYDLADSDRLLKLANAMSKTEMTSKEIAKRSGVDEVKVFGFVNGHNSLTIEEAGKIEVAIGVVLELAQKARLARTSQAAKKLDHQSKAKAVKLAGR